MEPRQLHPFPLLRLQLVLDAHAVLLLLPEELLPRGQFVVGELHQGKIYHLGGDQEFLSHVGPFLAAEGALLLVRGRMGFFGPGGLCLEFFSGHLIGISVVGLGFASDEN